ncbi:MAG: hypothetical protein KDN22_06830 [Verrucomicrobiae bacterium]|nr:hypothetical protein [Verrucomicrobiae bacterium]
MSLTDRANGSTPLRRLILYIVFVILAFIYVLFDESFWDITHKARSAADERNARNLVDLYMAASIAKPLELEDATDVATTIRALVNGVEGTGTFEGMVFKLPLEADEIARTEKYLRFEAGALTFHDAPGS